MMGGGSRSGGASRGGRLAIRARFEVGALREEPAFLLLWALSTAKALIAFIAMAALCDPLRCKARAVDRSEMYPDSDRQEGSHGAAQP